LNPGQRLAANPARVHKLNIASVSGKTTRRRSCLFFATTTSQGSFLATASSNCNVLLLHDLRGIGRTISAKFLHSADSVGKKVSRALGITCLKPRNNVGRKAKAFVSTLAVGRILAAPSCSLMTSLFSTASDECAIFFRKLFRSIGANGGDKSPHALPRNDSPSESSVPA